MISKTLSPEALKTINEYLHLPIAGHDVSCPYFNNRKLNTRAGLRALIGKGNVSDIVEESSIISLREKINLKNLDNAELKKFLIDNQIGIDCSGFIYHVLDAELRARGKGPIRKFIKFPFIKNPFRKLLTIIRPAEHAGARTLGHEINSHIVSLKDIRPGDMILMLEAGNNHNRNHILLIHQVDMDGDQPKILHYSHSFAWSSDGQYGHGVRQGKIELNSNSEDILKQSWVEQEKTLTENETFTHAQSAKSISLRRLLAL